MRRSSKVKAKPRPKKPEAPVTIIRSGYATDELWRHSIAQARTHGRTVVAIDMKGKIVTDEDLETQGVPDKDNVVNLIPPNVVDVPVYLKPVYLK